MNTPQFTKTLLAVSIAAVMAGCGGGSEDTKTADTSKTKTTNLQMSGAVVDGYIENATVCLDIDNNAVCDIGEPKTQTDAQGRYAFIYSLQPNQTLADLTNARVLVYGGIDTDTNKPFNARLRAPLNPKRVVDVESSSTATTITETKTLETNVTALSTLVAKTVDTGKTLEQAQTTIKTVLGLTDAESLEKDPIAALTGANVQTIAEAQKALAATVAINRAIETMVSAAQKADPSSNAQRVSDGVMAALVQVAQSAPNQARSVEKLVQDIPDVETASAALRSSVSEQAATQVSNATAVAAVTAKQTETTYSSATDTRSIQLAALQTTNVVNVIQQQINDETIDISSEITNVTSIEETATQAAKQNQQFLVINYLEEAGFKLADYEKTAIEAIQQVGSLQAFRIPEILAWLKSTSATASKTLIEKMEVTAELIGFIEEGIGASLTLDEVKAMRQNSGNLGDIDKPYDLSILQTHTDIPVVVQLRIKAKLDAVSADKLSAADDLIAFLTSNQVDLTADERLVIKQGDVRSLGNNYSLPEVKTFFSESTAFGDLSKDLPLRIDNATAFMTVLYSQASFDKSANCPAGGNRIRYGVDENRNGSLDDAGVTTVEACNGSDGTPAAISVTNATSAQCSGGGKVLLLGEQAYPICNVTSVTALSDSANFNEAKAVVAGFKNWITSLETYASSASDSLKEQAETLSALVSTDDMGANIASLALVAEAVAEAMKEFEVATPTVNRTWALNDLVMVDEMSDIASVSGNLIYNVADNSFTLEDVTVTVTVTASEPISVVSTVTVGKIGLPKFESSKNFSLLLNEFKATSDKASMSFGYAELEINLSDEVDLRGEDNHFDHATVKLTLGNEAQPIALTAQAESKEIRFTGRLGGELKAGRDGESRMAPTSLTNAHFNGQLAYDNQQVAVNLSLTMPQIQIKDGAPFIEKYGLDLTEGTLLDFTTITATDVTEDLPSSIKDYYPDATLKQGVRYDFELATGDKIPYLIAEFGNTENTDKIYSLHFVYQYDAYSFEYAGYKFGNANSFDDARDLLLIKAVNEFFDWSWSNDSEGSEQFVGFVLDTGRYTDGYMEVEGAIDFAAGLPLVNKTQSYGLMVEDVDITHQRPSYENHNRYTARAEIELKDLRDVEGNALQNASLAIQAERNGYVRSSGNLSFALSYGEQTFIANFSYPDQLSEDYSAQIPRRFEFSDNSGGVIVFDEMKYSTSGYEDDLVLPHYAKLYYHGIEYGYVTRDWQGNWLVGYHDETEDLVYRAR